MPAWVLNTPLLFENSFYFFKLFYIIYYIILYYNIIFTILYDILHYIFTLEICYFFKVLYFSSFSKNAIKHCIIKPFDVLNTISLTRTKTLVNNLFVSKF